MILNSIQFSNLNKINFLANKKTSGISFTQKPDTFERSQISRFEFTQEVSSQAKKEIIDGIKDIQTFNSTPLGIGATGVVYQLNNIDGFGPDGVVVKFSHTEEKNPITGEKQKPNCDFKDEIEKLKKAAPLKENSQQYLGRVRLNDGRYVLITTFIEGKTPDANYSPLNRESLKSLVDVLYKLDSAQVLHRDLKQENLLIDSSNNAKLIDFGEAISFDINDKKKNTEDLNFISFEMPTNFQNFEDTFLSPYYEQLRNQNPKKAEQFYGYYLNLKAENVYEKRAQELEEYVKLNSDTLSKEELEHIEEMQAYQKTMSKVLKRGKLDSSIIEIELLRNQITYLSELAYKNEILLSNPLANITLKTNALITAKKLEAAALKQLKRPNNPDVNRYLKYQIEIAKFRQEKIAGWLNGLVGWVCTCLTSDIDTQDEGKRKIIQECTEGENLDNFLIPNITLQRKENI